MILRCVCWSIFLCLIFRHSAKAQVQIDEQGYQNVMISFAPNVPSENGKELVQSIQDLLESTSSVLNTAIGIRIASATFLLPPSWPTETWENITVTPASAEQTETRPDIRLEGIEDSPFGKQPVTLQHGGCGVAGHQITLPLDFLSSTEGYPKGKLLAREWLKYRYGVFDENGFSGDPLYPDYYRVPGSSEIRITECTNAEVKYIYKKPFVDEVCDIESEDNFGNCRTHPESADNVTSSLMYFHEELPNMEHICGKDELPHHNTSRNKQNALCNGRSIWDVVKESDDFKTAQYQSDDPVPETIQFSYIQESQPRFVVLLENSDNLLEQEIPSAVKFALRRFYYDLPAKSKMAIYTYNSDVTEALPYTELSAQERSDLGVIADFGSPATSICTSCGLEEAAQTLLQKSEVEKGSILLITASSLDKVPELSEKVKESGICLHVLRFTDEDNPVDQTYDGLASSFHCFSHESLQMSLDVVDIFHVLSRFLKNPVPEFNDNFEIKTVASGNMSAQMPVTIPRDATASLYTLWLGRALGVSSIECKSGDNVVELKSDSTATDIASFTFVPIDDDVTCRLGSAKQSPALTEIQMKTQKGHYFDFDTWIHDVSSGNEQLPIIIYAKLYFGGYPVQDASVTTVVTLGDKQETVKMLDNGRGDPDVTQYDGIYSGYFTSFLEAGNYQIIVKTNDNEGRALIGKRNPTLMSATCCGSKVVSEMNEGVPAFEMEKQTVYEARNKTPDDGYPPSRILDLQVQISNNSKEVTLSWTAPGGGKASSYEFYAFCDLEDCEDGKLPKWLKLNESEPKPKSYGEPEEVVFLISPEITKIENLALFFAVKSVGEKGKASDLSNRAEILLSLSPEPSTTTAPITNDKKVAKSDTIGIIVGCTIIGVFLLLCLGAVLYFYVVKIRRGSKPSDIDTNDYLQDKNQNGTEVSGSFVPTRKRDASMRRVESFPVLLYTHDQLKDFKKKVDPPLYKPTIAARPWMSMNVLSNSELNKGGDSKSIGSASTLPMNDKHRSAEMKQLDDISLTSETPQSGEPIKF